MGDVVYNKEALFRDLVFDSPLCRIVLSNNQFKLIGPLGKLVHGTLQLMTALK